MPGVVIVTGGGRGIGASVSRLLAARGYHVAINYLSDEASARKVAAQLPKAVAIQGDVSQEADVLRLFQTTERELGPVAGLVNNAAITGGFARVDAVEAGHLNRMLAVNIAGTVMCAREAVRRMSTRHGGSGGAI